MSRRVLVTGGFGYLGGRVVAELAAAPDTEVIVTSRGGAWPDDYPRDGLAGVRVVALDLTRPAPADLCAGVTEVVHLAAANEIVSGLAPAAAVDATTAGTVRVLERALEAGVRRFVYLSTAHIYGAPLVGHLDECALPRPGHPYAITHRAAEDFVLAAADRGAIEAVVVRLSNAFGWPVWAGVDRWTLVVNDLCRQAVVDRALVLRSSGAQERDFICLGDATRAIRHLLEVPASQLGDGIFNLGGRATTRILDMAERVRARTAAVLGFTPTLSVGADPGGTAPPPLDYDCGRLAATGFHWRGDSDGEIDGLLRLCERAFSEAATT